MGCTLIQRQPICDTCFPNPALLRKPVVAMSPDGKVAIHVRRRERSKIWITELTLTRPGIGGSPAKIGLPEDLARDSNPKPLLFTFSNVSQNDAATTERNFSRTVMLCDTTQEEMAFVTLPEPNWTALLSTRRHPLPDEWHLTEAFDIAVNHCEFTGPSTLLVTYAVVSGQDDRNYTFSYDCKTGANRAPHLVSQQRTRSDR